MSEARTCPRCGGAFRVDLDAGPGICPVCLFRVIVEEASAATVRQAPAPEPDFPPDPHAPPEGLKDYEILGMLGHGGMGTVWKAKQRGLDRQVAIKVLGQRVEPEEVERFFREARAAAKLRHPNIVPVHEVSSEAGRVFYAMDFVDGETFEQAVKGGRLPLRKGLEALVTVARAVQFAHDNGVIHRDIKPANILLDRQGVPSIADFGLAKDVSSQAGMTRSGEILGTPSYMAPEQAGAKRGEIGTAADVYALGGTLYFLLTGRPPHEGTDVYDVLRKVIEEDPAPPRTSKPEISRDVETICQKALRKEAGSRYASAAAFADDLQRFLNGEAILARPLGAGERLLRAARKHRKSLALSSAAAAVVAAAFAVYLRGRPATLDVATDPPGAALSVDGRDIPAGRVTLPPGERGLRARRPGYEDWTGTLTLDPGSVRTLTIKLNPLLGYLSVEGRPENARIVLRGPEGRTVEKALPLNRLALPTGDYTYVVDADNRLDSGGRIRIAEGQESRLRVMLVERVAGLARNAQLTNLRDVQVTSDGVIHLLGAGKAGYVDSSELRYSTWRGAQVRDDAGIERFLGASGDLLLALGSDGAVEARTSPAGAPAWKSPMPSWRVNDVHVARNARIFVAALRGPVRERRTLLRCLAAADGGAAWERELEGALGDLSEAPDADGDAVPDLLAWGVDVALVSSADGRVLKRIARGAAPALKDVAAWTGGLALITPKELRVVEAATEKPLWAEAVEEIRASAVVRGPGGPAIATADRAALTLRDGRDGRPRWPPIAAEVDSGMLVEEIDGDGVDDLVFREGRRAIRCVSGATGRTLWVSPLEDMRYTSLPLVGLAWAVDAGGQRKILAAFASGDVLAIRPELSAEAVFEPRSMSMLKASAFLPDGPDDARLISFDAGVLRGIPDRGDRGVWSASLEGVPGPARNALLAAARGGAVVVFGVGPEGGRAAALRVRDGAKLWERALPGAAAEEPKAVLATSLGEDVVLAGWTGPRGANVALLGAGTGEPAWTLEIPTRSLLAGLVPEEGGDILLLLRDRAESGTPVRVNGRVQWRARRDGSLTKERPVWLGRESRMPWAAIVAAGADPLIYVYPMLQRLRGSDGSVMWIRDLALGGDELSLSWSDVGGGRHEVIAGGFGQSLGLDGATGETRWRAAARPLGPPREGSRTLFSPYAHALVEVESRTGKVLRKAPLRIREDGKALALVLENGRPAVAMLGHEGVTFARPIFEADTADTLSVVGDSRRRRASPRTATPALTRTEPARVPAGTAREAAERFLAALRFRDPDALRTLGRLGEPATWIGDEWLSRVESGGRDGLVELLDLPELRPVERGFQASIVGIRESGDTAVATLSRPAGWLGGEWDLRRSEGAWTVVVKSAGPAAAAGSEAERKVLEALKPMSTALFDYRANDRDGDGVKAFWVGDVAGLFAGGLDLIPREVALADAAPRREHDLNGADPAVPFHDYVFEAVAELEDGAPLGRDLNKDGVPGENATRVAVCAWSAEPGRRTFLLLAEGGSVDFWVKDTGGKPVRRIPTPERLRAEWRRPD